MFSSTQEVDDSFYTAIEVFHSQVNGSMDGSHHLSKDQSLERRNDASSSDAMTDVSFDDIREKNVTKTSSIKEDILTQGHRTTSIQNTKGPSEPSGRRPDAYIRQRLETLRARVRELEHNSEKLRKENFDLRIEKRTENMHHAARRADMLALQLENLELRQRTSELEDELRKKNEVSDGPREGSVTVKLERIDEDDEESLKPEAS